MRNASSLIPIERIASQIFVIRGQKVMLDQDLAALYGVETRALNQAVTRNRSPIPGGLHVPAVLGGVQGSKVTECDLRE